MTESLQRYRRDRQINWEDDAREKKARLVGDMTRIIDVLSAKTGERLFSSHFYSPRVTLCACLAMSV